MTEYIEREAALEFEMEVEADPDDIQAITNGMALYAEYIKTIPVADVAPVKRGHWITVDGCMTICSECGSVGCKSKYCQYCGAKMEGGNDRR